MLLRNRETPESTTKKMIDPRNSFFEPETLNLFEEVDASIKAINKNRPFPTEVEQKLTIEFLPDRITASLNIEGISVSRRQTLLMMDAMTLTENNSKAENEIYNALKADEFVYGLFSEKHPLTSAAVREINKILQNGILTTAGDFRTKDVEITGAAFQPPIHTDVPHLVSAMIAQFDDLGDLHPIFKAAWLHSTFTHIHPFEDGNGRTGRLLQDFVLLANGLFPTGIPSSARDDYYDALEQADDGNWNPLCQMICHLELRITSRVRAILDEQKSRGQFIDLLSRRASQKKQGGLHKKYTVWRQRMENFGNQLIETCDELNRNSDVIGVRSDRFDVIDFQKWQDISARGRAENTWLVKQTWFSEGQAFYRTVLYFARHNFRPEDIATRDDLYGTVALRLTGGDPNLGSRFDFNAYTDSEIRFRELLFLENSLYYYTDNGDISQGVRNFEKWKCDTVDSPSLVIQHFLEDVFVRKLGI